MIYTVSDRGKLDEAAAVQQEGLKKQQCMLSNEHLKTIVAMSNLAAMLSDQGKLDEAAAGQQEVLEKRQPAHPWRRAPKHDHIYDKNEYDEDFYRGGEGIQEYSMDENDLAVMFAMEKNKVDATDMVDLECRDDAEGENADPWWGKHGVFENENENENAGPWCRMHEDFVDEVRF